MQVVIIGAGKVGVALAEALLKRDDDVVLIDQGDAWVVHAKHLDCRKISGVVIDEDVLESADIRQADVVCAVTQSDNINIMASLMARQLFGVKKVISRLYNPEKKFAFDELGLEVISSTGQTVDAILRDMDDAGVIMSHRMYGKTLEYHNVPVDDELIGQELSDIVTMDGQVVLGLLRAGTLYPITSALEIEENDQVVLIEVS
ncbi:MAG TPA: hypothetical protein GXZ64_09190 [Clostridiaceae bacterium]|jgi:trk system potassium uptake protein TrkA|nr:hypothetical protein [Clostridiaceae bacterium]